MSRTRHEVTLRRVRYDVPGTTEVIVRRGIEYAAPDAVVRTIDAYYPATSTRRTPPAVLLISGLSDVNAVSFLGCRINEMEAYVSWARLIAASGLVAVTYSTGPDPAADTRDVIGYLRTHGDELQIDPTKLGLWACSSHGPNALAPLMAQPEAFGCAAFLYPFMLDLDGPTSVAEAQRTWRFANPSAGRSLDDLPENMPMLIVRAGHDENPGLNESIDRFVSHALKRNRPISLLNHHSAPHAFDLLEDTATTRAVVRVVLEFLRSQLE